MDGLLEGDQYEYYVNGSLFSEIEYSSGVKHGSEKFYTKNGILDIVNNYKNGIKIN